MRTQLDKTVRAALALCLLAGPGSAFADQVPGQAFDRAIHEAYLDILETRRAMKIAPAPQAPPRKTDILKTSERVFNASPAAAASLSHLRGFVARKAAEEDKDDLAAAPARDLLSADSSGVAALVGLSAFWNQAQHQYDRAADYRSPVAQMSGELPVPVEMEQRGWEAGCRFWKAGASIILQPAAAQATPSPFYCETEFPAAYYCHLYFAVEIVVLTAQQIKALGTKSEPLTSSFENILAAYCGEYERAEKGNPLDLKGFTSQWGESDCVGRALKTVLDPSWKSSMEQCPGEHPSGPDIRQAARDVEGGL
jgi:hypothetical protein